MVLASACKETRRGRGVAGSSRDCGGLRSKPRGGVHDWKAALCTASAKENLCVGMAISRYRDNSVMVSA